MSRFYKNKNLLSVVLSIVLSFAFVVLAANAATTISTNINTGGTLTVTGTSAFTGNITSAGSVTLGNAAGDVILSTGGFQASSTAFFGDSVISYATTTISGAYTLVLGSSTADLNGATAGAIFYDSDDKVIRLYDGDDWFTVGTTTSGLTLSGLRLQLASNSYYMTFGTTTQQGLSMLTLSATSTAAIPLTLEAYNSQTANTFQIVDSASVNLLYVNSGGALFASSTLQITGAVTTYGGVTLGDAASDDIIIIGNASTTNSLTIGGLASTTSLVVGGGTEASNIVFGSCFVANTTISASTTVAVDCTSATGILTTHNVFVNATSSLHRDFIIQSASSSAADTIGLMIYNTGSLGTTTTAGANAPTTISFMGIR